MLRRAAWYKFTDVSHHPPLKRYQTYTRLHGATTQKKNICTLKISLISEENVNTRAVKVKVAYQLRHFSVVELRLIPE
jgi:hypothetical protein